MHLLFQQYAQWFNRRHDRDGPLFKQRFTAHALDVGSPFLRVTRYIDQNPVKAGMVDRPSQYPWGSAIHYHRGELPHWLCGDLVKAHLQRELTSGLSLPEAYLAGFGGPMTVQTYRELETRIGRDLSTHQAASVLPSFESADALEWFGERAQLADGLELLTGRLILPSELEEHLSRHILNLRLAAEANRPIGRRLSQLHLVRTALLRHVCRLSVVETAEYLGTSKSTVSSHVRRHLRALQQDDRYRRFFATLLTTLESTTRSLGEKGQSLFSSERSPDDGGTYAQRSRGADQSSAGS